MVRTSLALLLLLTGIAGVVSPAVAADVDVVRWGEENPVLTIAKSAFWGGLAGLLIGGAVALVAEDDEADIIKWGFALGVFGGTAFGIYHVMTREKPTTGLLQVDDGALALRTPTFELRPAPGDRHGLDGRVTLFATSF